MGIKALGLRIFRRIDDILADRIGPIRVLFVVRNEIGLANQAPVMREMLKYPDILVQAMSDGDEPEFHFDDPALQSLYDSVKVSMIRGVFRKWHYIICTDVLNLYFKRDAIHVTMGHGCCFGNSINRSDWIVQQIIQSSVRMVFGHSMALKAHAEATHPDIFHADHRLFFPTGFPKLDVLCNGQLSRSDLLQQLGLSPDRKTILLTSHWTETSVLREWKEQIVESLLPLAQQMNIIVTAHPKLWELKKSSGFSSKSLWESLKAVEARSKYLRLVKSANSEQLLNAADLLICDNSSIRVEYSVTDRPVLFYNNPDHRFFSPVTQKLYEDSAENFVTLDGLADRVVAALNNPQAYAEGRAALRGYFVHNAGNAAASIVDIIRAVGRISNPASPNWTKAVQLSRRYSYESVTVQSETRQPAEKRKSESACRLRTLKPGTPAR